MGAICELVDTQEYRKRHIESPSASDVSPIKKQTSEYSGTDSLLVLNDDCLLSVFEHLSQSDLCNVQNVCRRFAPLAETAFRSNVIRRPDWVQFQPVNSMPNRRRIFYKFGHLFRSFHAWGKLDSDILQRMTHLTRLTLLRVALDSEIVGVIHSAKHLEVLNMYHCDFENESSGNSSKSVNVLRRLTCQDQLPPLHTFSEFLQYNQQLNRLGLPTGIPESYVRSIVQHAPQLTELVLFITKYQTTAIIELISNLKALKMVTINAPADMISPLLNTHRTKLLVGMQETNPGITDLQLNDFVFDSDVMTIISKMKNLQHLALKGKFVCLENDFVSLVASLPCLNKFTVSFKSCTIGHQREHVTFTFDTLRDIVDAGSNIDFLSFRYARDIHIDEMGYAELLDILKRDIRKQKISLVIEGCKLTTSFVVPKCVQRKNLEIDFTKNKSCGCIEVIRS